MKPSMSTESMLDFSVYNNSTESLELLLNAVKFAKFLSAYYKDYDGDKSLILWEIYKSFESAIKFIEEAKGLSLKLNVDPHGISHYSQFGPILDKDK